MEKELLELLEEAKKDHSKYEVLEEKLREKYPQISDFDWEADYETVDGEEVKLHIVFVKMPYMLPYSGSSYAHFRALEDLGNGEGLEAIMKDMKVIEYNDVFGGHSNLEFENYWTDLESRGYEVVELKNTPGEEYDNAFWQVVREIREEEGLTTKYLVVDTKGKEVVYEGFNQEEALKILKGYNDACGDWYLEQYEME